MKGIGRADRFINLGEEITLFSKIVKSEAGGLKKKVSRFKV